MKGAAIMLMHSSTTNPAVPAGPSLHEEAASGKSRTIAVVNGDERAVSLLDAVLESGRYDVVFVASAAHAYSQIKSLQPGLVVLCTRLGQMDGFHVLTMLKLDPLTRSIPVLTCATEFEGPQDEEPIDVEAIADTVSPAPVGRLH